MVQGKRCILRALLVDKGRIRATYLRSFARLPPPRAWVYKPAL